MNGRSRGRPSYNDELALLVMARHVLAAARDGHALSDRAAALAAVHELGISPIVISTPVNRLRRAFARRRNELLAEAGGVVENYPQRINDNPLGCEAAYVVEPDQLEAGMAQPLAALSAPELRSFDDFPAFVAARDKLGAIREDLRAVGAEIDRVQLELSRAAAGLMLGREDQVEAAKQAYLGGHPVPELRSIQDRLTSLNLRRDAIGRAFAEQRTVMLRERAAAEREIVAEALVAWRDRHLSALLDVLEQLAAVLEAEQDFRDDLAARGVASNGNKAWDAVMSFAVKLGRRADLDSMLNGVAVPAAAELRREWRAGADALPIVEVRFLENVPAAKGTRSALGGIEYSAGRTYRLNQATAFKHVLRGRAEYVQ